MIPDKTRKQLKDPNKQIRIQAVKILARSSDPEAIPLLSDVYSNDPDQEVRQLAAKAGRYLKRQTQTFPTISNLNLTDDMQLGSVIITPEIIGKAESEMRKAETMYQRNDRKLAYDHLLKAFELNPNLFRDQHAIQMLIEISGRPERIALIRLKKDLNQKKGPAKRGVVSVAFLTTSAVVILLASLAILLSFFVFPWLETGNIVIQTNNAERTFLTNTAEQMSIPFDPNHITAGTVLAIRQKLYATISSKVPDNTSHNRAFKEVLDAYSTIKLGLTGLETFMVILESHDIYELMGITQAARVANDKITTYGTTLVQGMTLDASNFAVNNDPVGRVTKINLALILIPMIAVVCAIVSIPLILARGLSVRLWAIILVLGMLLILPAMLFLTQTGISLTRQIDLGILTSGILDADRVTSLGSGFWVALVGIFVMIIIPAGIFITAGGSIHNTREINDINEKVADSGIGAFT